MHPRIPIACGWLLTTALLGGCTTDQYARMLLEQDTSYGKINEAMVGSSEQLVQNGQISAARRYTMPDGTDIDVWILQASSKVAPRGTVLVLHGLCDAKITYLRLGKMLAEKGFDVVLPDLRAHGRSGGKLVTYGALEKRDQLRVINHLLEEKVVREPLYVFGASMGASVAIQYAALDPRVRGVMAMAPYRDMESVFRRFLARMAPLMSEKDIRKVIARAGQIGKFDPAEASTLAAIRKLRVPTLLVHGMLDTLTPFGDSKALSEAAGGPVRLELIPWAGHIGILFGREANIVHSLEQLASGRLEATTKPAGK